MDEELMPRDPDWDVVPDGLEELDGKIGTLFHGDGAFPSCAISTA